MAKIGKNIPLMEVGDLFLVKTRGEEMHKKKRGMLSAIMARLHKAGHGKSTLRTVEGEVRVWKIE